MKKSWGETFQFSAIGRVISPFTDKFGVPRQPGLVTDAKGILKLDPDPDLRTSLRTLEQFSHLWIVFVFHQHGGKNWKPSIRPPRLGGSVKVGVLASRSPHRPNPIGISAVTLEKIDLEAPGGPEIHVGGVDLLDGTPILDIKPYIPYADAIPDANPGWAAAPITRTPVEFSPEANLSVQKEDASVRGLIIQMLELDPRPAFQKKQFPPESPSSWGKAYGFNIRDLDVQFEIREGRFFILSITKIPR